MAKAKPSKSKFKKAKNNNSPDTNIRSVKCGLKSSLRAELTREFKQDILRVISAKSIQHTWLWQLASLQFLYRVNDNFDRGNWPYFDKDNAQATTEIENCFKSVLRAHVNNEQYEMPPGFRQMCENVRENVHGFEFPDLWMDNSFKYACATYERNCITNLKCHEKNRIGKFLRLTIDRLNRDYDVFEFTQKDIDNTMKFIFEGEYPRGIDDQEIGYVEMLTDILVQNGAPSTHTITEYQEANWFKLLPMWIQIQRTIELENERRSQSNEHLYKLSNFSVVPLCGFTRKFVEIDSCDLRTMMKTWNVCPKDYSSSKRGRFISDAEFTKHKESHWNILFNMQKIKKLSRHEFRFHILSDGVAVVFQYDKASPACEKDTPIQSIIAEKIDNGEIDYEIGIDPGMRTYMAVVRRDARTGAEVSLSTKRFD